MLNLISICFLLLPVPMISPTILLFNSSILLKHPRTQHCCCCYSVFSSNLWSFFFLSILELKFPRFFFLFFFFMWLQFKCYFNKFSISQRLIAKWKITTEKSASIKKIKKNYTTTILPQFVCVPFASLYPESKKFSSSFFLFHCNFFVIKNIYHKRKCFTNNKKKIKTANKSFKPFLKLHKYTHTQSLTVVCVCVCRL